MKKFKQLATNWRILLLVILLFLSYVSIQPDLGREGVAIRSVTKNSSAALAGIHNPLAADKPMMREVITDINGVKIRSMDDYYNAVNGLAAGDVVKIGTESKFNYDGDKRTMSFIRTKHDYTLTVLPRYKTEYLDEFENITTQRIEPYTRVVNGSNVTLNRTINETTQVQKQKKTIIGAEDIGIKVYDAPTTNLKKGLELQGGTRVLLKPETETVSEVDIVIENLKQRLNVYGLSDIVVTNVNDLSGQQFILVEVAGATEEEVEDLIGRQGKFEAKIGNDTVFRGGEDIKFVCRSAECSYAQNPMRPCSMIQGTSLYQCNFQFSITLSPEAAKRQADLTRDLSVVREQDGSSYLNESLGLYLDDELVDTLRIGSDLKGKDVTDIAISGPGTGASLQEAMQNSAQAMKKLQTVLVTGSLPVKLEIVQVETVSPLLGKEFVENAILVVLLSVVAVSIVVSVRYRSYRISIPIVITMLAEIVLILGMASLIGWNIDLAAIAAILVAVGTGVDDQIVIADETLATRRSQALNWKDKLKRAFYIIMSAYAVSVAAMIPLWSAGAGLLKGFAITTILGLSFGVFVTRPAFAAMVEILTKE